MNYLTNVKKYDIYDVINVFYFIFDHPNCSRKNICDFIEIGEGSLKSILNFLKEKDLIVKSQSGNSLSEKGLKIIELVKNEIGNWKKLDYDIFKDGFNAFGINLKNYDSKKIEHIYFARDYAIRSGCWSAMILKFDGNDIKLNKSEELNFNELGEEFSNLIENDLVIVTSAQTKRIALKGILKILEYLNKNLGELFEKEFSL